MITRGEIRNDSNDTTPLLERQALHALRLSLKHPETDAAITFEAPLPADMQGVLTELQSFRRLKERPKA